MGGDCNDAEEADYQAGMMSRLYLKIAQDDPETFRPTPLIAGTTIADGTEADYLKRFLVMTTNPVPLPRLNTGQATNLGAAEYEAERRIWNARMAMVQDVLTDELVSKTGTIAPSEWQYAYLEEAKTDADGKVSLMEALRADVDGRLMTPGWFQNIKQMSAAGVTREQVYQKATQLKLMWELLKREDHTVRLQALQTALALEADRSRVLGMRP